MMGGYAGLMFCLTLHLQSGLGYSPLRAGLDYSPCAVGFRRDEPDEQVSVASPARDPSIAVRSITSPVERNDDFVTAAGHVLAHSCGGIPLWLSPVRGRPQLSDQRSPGRSKARSTRHR